MRFSDWSSDVGSSDLIEIEIFRLRQRPAVTGRKTDDLRESRKIKGRRHAIIFRHKAPDPASRRHAAEHRHLIERNIGSAQGREKGGQYGKISVMAESLKTKKIQYTLET